MTAPANPLIPTGYDIVWWVAALALLILAVGAVVSIIRSSRGLTGTATAVWILLVIALPVLGSVAWFAAGRGPARRDLRSAA